MEAAGRPPEPFPEYSAITGGTENWVVSYSGFMIAMVVLGWLNYKILKWKRWV